MACSRGHKPRWIWAQGNRHFIDWDVWLHPHLWISPHDQHFLYWGPCRSYQYTWWMCCCVFLGGWETRGVLGWGYSVGRKNIFKGVERVSWRWLHWCENQAKGGRPANDLKLVFKTWSRRIIRHYLLRNMGWKLLGRFYKSCMLNLCITIPAKSYTKVLE